MRMRMPENVQRRRRRERLIVRSTREKRMTATVLPQMVACSAASIANPAFQPPSDPILTVNLGTQDGTNFLLPLSEGGATQLFQVISEWWQVRDLMRGKER